MHISSHVYHSCLRFVNPCLSLCMISSKDYEDQRSTQQCIYINDQLYYDCVRLDCRHKDCSLASMGII